LIHKADKIIKEFVDDNIWSVILTGGEPLLHPNLLIHIIKKCNQYGISAGLNTNLTLINEEIARRLVEECNWRNIILTSLPSLDESCCDKITKVSGSYKRILEGISICKSYGLKVGINTVVTKENIGDLKKYVDFVKTMKIDYVSISEVIPPIYDVDNPIYYLDDGDLISIADTLLEVKKECGIDIGSVTPLPLCILKDATKYLPVLDTTCLAGVSKCTVELETGNVFACSHEENEYGNIYVDGLKSCWDKMQGWSKNDNINEMCVSCKWLYLCGGECRMQRYGERKPPLYNIDAQANITFDSKEVAVNFDFPGDNERLCISSKMKVRKEHFGYIVRVGYIETNLSDKLYSFCEKMKEKEFFTLKSLDEIVEMDDMVKKVIKTLLQRGIIERVE
jgi:radical SAM protein with 4Fe4S-binding SPASM domain